jgi:hypothetical protein
MLLSASHTGGFSIRTHHDGGVQRTPPMEQSSSVCARAEASRMRAQAPQMMGGKGGTYNFTDFAAPDIV